MKENKREGSMVTTTITALVFFLVLALFGKSVQATELISTKIVKYSPTPFNALNVAGTENNSFTRTGIDHQVMFCKSTSTPHTRIIITKAHENKTTYLNKMTRKKINTSIYFASK